jgi:CRISPR-associated protein Cmr2
VVAHHQAPLGAVLRELRLAEKRAKHEGGRDAFSLTVVKRSGGALSVTAKWGEAVAVLQGVMAFLREPAVSRRAVYNAMDWLKDLPADAEAAMLAKLLAHQWRRQCDEDAAAHHDLPALCGRLAALAVTHSNRLDWLASFLGVAEFLARETRASE